MTRVDVRDDTLVITVNGLDRIVTWTKGLAVPLAHVLGATHDPGMGWGVRGVKLGGARIPGVVTAGRFRQDGERVFWDVRNPKQAVVIRLREERYAQLVIQVEDPRATVEEIQSAIAAPPA